MRMRDIEQGLADLHNAFDRLHAATIDSAAATKAIIDIVEADERLNEAYDRKIWEYEIPLNTSWV